MPRSRDRNDVASRIVVPKQKRPHWRRVNRRHASTGPLRVPRRFPIVRILAGIVMCVLVGIVFVATTSALNNRAAYHAAPVCAAGADDDGCRSRVAMTVQDTRIERSENSESWDIYVTSDLGDAVWVKFGQYHRAFAAATAKHRTVTGEFWQDKIAAVTAGGMTEETEGSPSVNVRVTIILLFIAAVAGCLCFRGAARARLWRRLDYRADEGPAVNRMRLFDLITLVLAIVGAIVIQFSVIAAAALLGLTLVLCLWTLVVPEVVPGGGRPLPDTAPGQKARRR